MVQSEAVSSAIRRALPDAQVSVEDLTGGGDHLQVTVVSAQFEGLTNWSMALCVKILRVRRFTP